MPQPLKGALEAGCRFGTLILEQRPVCAGLIGLISAEWTHLEDQLSLMFSLATSDVTVTNGSVSFKSHPVAVASMRSLDSQRSRHDVIAKSFELVLPVNFQDEFDILSRSIRKCSSGRNTAVHGIWGINDRYPEDIILDKGGWDFWRYTPQDFRDTIGRIIDQTRLILEFRTRCQEYLTEKNLKGS